MSQFEPFDDELANALRRRAGSIDSSELTTDAAHDAVLARARGIRRRRAVTAGGAAMAAVVLGGFVLLSGGNGEESLVPASQPATVATPSAPSAAPTTTPVTTPAPTQTTTAVTTPATTQITTAATTPTTTHTTSHTTSQTTNPATAPPSAPTTETHGSSGGSITVTWDGTALRLVSVDPAAGHESEIEDETAARIRVRFRGPNESRIEVRVENGTPTVRID